jgi:hypothetical protein
MPKPRIVWQFYPKLGHGYWMLKSKSAHHLELEERSKIYDMIEFMNRDVNRPDHLRRGPRYEHKR